MQFTTVKVNDFPANFFPARLDFKFELFEYLHGRTIFCRVSLWFLHPITCLCMGNDRHEFIDLMKGICILLVVLNHSGVPWFLDNVALSVFKLPLYYFLSGLFFKSYNSFTTFFLKKNDSLVVPYVTTWILLNLLLLVFGILGVSSYKIVYAPRTIWFLLSLFEVSLLYYFITRIKNSKLQFLVVAMLSLAGFYLFKTGMRLPLMIDTALTGLLFYFMGDIVKRLNLLQYMSRGKNLLYLTMSVTIFFLVFFISDVQLMNMKYNIYPSGYLNTLLLSSSGIMTVLFFSKIVNSIPMVSFFGRYSIIVLCFHMIYLSAVDAVVGSQPFLTEGIASIIIFLTMMIFIYPTILLVKGYTPFLYAQKPFLQVVFSPSESKPKMIKT